MASSGGRVDSTMKSFDPSKMYDLTSEDRRAIEERAKMRDLLRKDYQKKVTNPHRGVGGYIVSCMTFTFSPELGLLNSGYKWFKIHKDTRKMR